MMKQALLWVAVREMAFQLKFLTDNFNDSNPIKEGEKRLDYLESMTALQEAINELTKEGATEFSDDETIDIRTTLHELIDNELSQLESITQEMKINKEVERQDHLNRCREWVGFKSSV